ncbi:alpha-2,8-sialyltransferase 8E-like [Aplochiton taeniatus]
MGQKIHYETNQKRTKTVNKELHNMLPQHFPWSGAGLGRCAVIGSGGILKNSKCGGEIDSHDYIIRFNLAPINDSEDVGNRSSLVTINASQIRNGYPNLKKNGSSLANRVSAYGNASLLMSPFSYTFVTPLSLAVHEALRLLRPNQSVLFFNPDYLVDIDRRWKGWGLKEHRLSTGMMLVTVAMELCQEVHLYGYWPFSTDLSEKPILHHYYDNVLPHPRNHVMSQEFLFLLQLHSQGALQLHLGTCSI